MKKIKPKFASCEKTLDLNKNNFEKIFINKYSIINRKIDTLTIYGTKTINKTINNFQQVSLILSVLNFSNPFQKS